MAVLAVEMLIVSCTQKNVENKMQSKAVEFLSPMLHVGEFKTNIVARFGTPNGEYETQNHEVCDYFNFSHENCDAYSHGVGGFTAFFTNDQLVHWEPIYIRGPADNK